MSITSSDRPTVHSVIYLLIYLLFIHSARTQRRHCRIRGWLKSREWTTSHGQICSGGKRESGQVGTKKQGWTTQEWVVVNDNVRCRCHCWNPSFLRLVAAAASIFCWAQCLCVCAYGMAHSRQKLHSSVGATTECGHARLDALIVQHVDLILRSTLRIRATSLIWSVVICWRWPRNE